jgi:hypothetical protein
MKTKYVNPETRKPSAKAAVLGIDASGSVNMHSQLKTNRRFLKSTTEPILVKDFFQELVWKTVHQIQDASQVSFKFFTNNGIEKTQLLQLKDSDFIQESRLEIQIQSGSVYQLSVILDGTQNRFWLQLGKNGSERLFYFSRKLGFTPDDCTEFAIDKGLKAATRICMEQLRALFPDQFKKQTKPTGV